MKRRVWFGVFAAFALLAALGSIGGVESRTVVPNNSPAWDVGP